MLRINLLLFYFIYFLASLFFTIFFVAGYFNGQLFLFTDYGQFFKSWVQLLPRLVIARPCWIKEASQFDEVAASLKG